MYYFFGSHDKYSAHEVGSILRGRRWYVDYDPVRLQFVFYPAQQRRLPYSSPTTYAYSRCTVTFEEFDDFFEACRRLDARGFKFDQCWRSGQL